MLLYNLLLMVMHYYKQGFNLRHLLLLVLMNFLLEMLEEYIGLEKENIEEEHLGKENLEEEHLEENHLNK